MAPGQIGSEVTYAVDRADSLTASTIPRSCLPRARYGVLFEGRPGAISADGRLLVLPDLRAWAAAGSTGPGLVVSILGERGPGGVPDSSPARRWFRVAQQVSLSSNNTIELLMEDPAAPMPAGGYYVVEVTSGFVNNTFDNNQIDLAGKSSIGIVLNGADFGYADHEQSVRRRIERQPCLHADRDLGHVARSARRLPARGRFLLPQGWTALPDLGTVVQG